MIYLMLFAILLLSQLYIVILVADIIMNIYYDHNDLIYYQITYVTYQSCILQLNHLRGNDKMMSKIIILNYITETPDISSQ